MEYDEFFKKETIGMKRRYDTYCAGPHGLVGKVIITLVDLGTGTGKLYHVDRVDHVIHLKNGLSNLTCPIEFYWRMIALYD